MSAYRPYPKYKDSGVEWLGEVPEKWDVSRIKNVATINASKSEVSHLDPETEISFLPMEAVGDDGSLDTSNSRQLGDVLTGYTYVRENDVLVAKITPCFENGKGCIARGLNNGIGFATTEVVPIRPNRLSNPEFLYYLLHGLPFRKVAEGSMYGAGGQKRVSDTFVAGYSFALPPLPEQRQIASFLDRECGKLDALQAKQERLIELLKEKRQALISHAVTRGLDPTAKLKPSGIEWLGDVPMHWRVGKCGFYLTILSGFAFPSNGFTQDESGTKLLRGINVGVSRIKWDDTVYWQRTENDGLGCYEMKAGDLVVGMDRPWISGGVRVAKITENDLPCLLLQRVTSLKTNSSLLTDYLYRFLSSEMFVAYFTPDTTGVSVPHLSPDQICDFVIPLPPLAEQRAIVAHLDEKCGKIDQLKAKAERAIVLLKERRSALISAAVTGKIDVRKS